MKITKYIHSCLLVEMPAPINRTMLFDPGKMSEVALNIDHIEFLDDIIITHEHFDHFHPPLLHKLVAKFPNVHITAPSSVVRLLQAENIAASSEPSEGIAFFNSPHEAIRPLYPYDPPEEIGVHYLNLLSHPGDSHHFSETMPILALPVTGPWGSVVAATKLGLELKPQHILPIHDWHWSDAARESSYDTLEEDFAAAGITFHKLKTGEPIVIDL